MHSIGSQYSLVKYVPSVNPNKKILRPSQINRRTLSDFKVRLFIVYTQPKFTIPFINTPSPFSQGSNLKKSQGQDGK